MIKYINIEDLKNNKIELDSNGNIIIRDMPTYKIISTDGNHMIFYIENLKTKKRFNSRISNLIRIYDK
ncbi:hypothetical protein [Clostridium beijerinckii]|uniref:hypothetical protein n=1 Tax=Clostridium beijerinckii TaxID=1520 RepID=UPI00156D9309|nr:hypothetical protein [Clostridium beijerinckii]NRU52490.1 hypothetical protein [Clostridium beijerinckii]NYC69065.1 hypothetical protein [Clostridium beijerinckii]NYC91691.1 hypothetical protein [Clostridium beijerinckii]